MNAKDTKEDQRLLELLDVVGQRSDVSQRDLAQQMGVALGLANSYLRRCVRKGFIKITSAPANRYFYYLTPKGFSEKSRLTAKYLSTSFSFYREASASCLRTLRECQSRGWRQIVLSGASDLAEIALLQSFESGITVVGVIDPISDRKMLLGRQVWRSTKEAKAFDGCVVTELQASRERYEQLTAELGQDLVLVPDILRL